MGSDDSPAPGADRDTMRWSRFSFFYLASYLTATGVALLFAPQWSLHLLGATGSYGDAFVRFVGSFMIALGTIVVQIIRFRLEILYRTTLAIRLFFMAVILYLYASTNDVLFLVILGVVTLGVAFTAAGFVVDRRRGSR